ncbi:hypothetical protein BOX15_Mlig007114g1, partial [Macrostomum lignano]
SFSLSKFRQFQSPMTSSALSEARRRQLPRCQEVLSRAERSRFYKERARRHKENALLELRLQRLAAEREAAEQRLRRQTAEVRQLALVQRDQARETREADSRLLEAVMRKIQLNKQVGFEQAIKYKSKKVQQQLREQQQLQLEAPRTPPTPPPPPPPPQLDLRLIWPGLRSRGHFRRLYAQLLLAQPGPDEARRRGDECLQALAKNFAVRVGTTAGEDAALTVAKAPAVAAASAEELRLCWTR